MSEKMLTTDQAAEMLGITGGSLRRWRTQGIGPAYIKYPSTVFYEREAIEEWINSSRVATLSQGLQEALAPAMEQYSRGLDADTERDHGRAAALMDTSIQMIWEALRKVDKTLPPIWEIISPENNTTPATSAYERYDDGQTIYDL